ncbi:MAG: S24/S26 family peptidase [Blastocatellia bacterium]|nr:S24/S26 family peptidase [Blastocatellia bacterium]
MRAQSIKTERGPVIRLETPDLLKKARYELSRQHPILLRVSGTAMLPALADGDLVTIHPIQMQTVRDGDIVLYQSLRDTALIHRIVRVEHRSAGRFVVTRADASQALDTPVPIHHIMGRVTSIDRDGELIEVVQEERGVAGLFRRILDWLGRGWRV